jgi:F-type H+-transporting ATPase subunit h
VFSYHKQAKDAHVGVVKNYSKPAVPKAPALPADIASELSAYDASEPQHADAPAAKTASFGEDAAAGAGAAAFLELLEEDLPKPEEHHH